MDDDIEWCRVVGVSHYQDALEGCAQGDPVRFFHEPDNPHDPMAIRVATKGGQTIGYLPRASNLHRLVHEGGRGISATIGSMGRSRACLIGLTLQFAVTDDRPAVASFFPGQPAPEEPKGGFRYWVGAQ